MIKITMAVLLVVFATIFCIFAVDEIEKHTREEKMMCVDKEKIEKQETEYNKIKKRYESETKIDYYLKFKNSDGQVITMTCEQDCYVSATKEEYYTVKYLDYSETSSEVVSIKQVGYSKNY